MENNLPSLLSKFGYERLAPKRTKYPIYSKDKGTFQRVFVPDVKDRGDHVVIFGSIGIIDWAEIDGSPSSPPSKIGSDTFSIYITNFLDLSPPEIYSYASEEDFSWMRAIDKIVDQFPSNKSSLVAFCRGNESIGGVEAKRMIINITEFQKYLDR